MTIEELHKLNDKKNGQARISAKDFQKAAKAKARRDAKKAAPTEHALQVACVNLFRALYPDLILFAIPNGGKRSIKTAAAMKAEGQTAGIPDLFLALPSGRYAGAFVELKNGDANTTTATQKAMIARLEAAGYYCAVCRSLEEFEGTIKKYLAFAHTL